MTNVIKGLCKIDCRGDWEKYVAYYRSHEEYSRDLWYPIGITAIDRTGKHCYITPALWGYTGKNNSEGYYDTWLVDTRLTRILYGVDDDKIYQGSNSAGTEFILDELL